MDGLDLRQAPLCQLVQVVYAERIKNVVYLHSDVLARCDLAYDALVRDLDQAVGHVLEKKNLFVVARVHRDGALNAVL